MKNVIARKVVVYLALSLTFLAWNYGVADVAVGEPILPSIVHYILFATMMFPALISAFLLERFTDSFLVVILAFATSPLWASLVALIQGERLVYEHQFLTIAFASWFINCITLAFIAASLCLGWYFRYGLLKNRIGS